MPRFPLQVFAWVIALAACTINAGPRAAEDPPRLGASTVEDEPDSAEAVPTESTTSESDSAQPNDAEPNTAEPNADASPADDAPASESTDDDAEGLPAADAPPVTPTPSKPARPKRAPPKAAKPKTKVKSKSRRDSAAGERPEADITLRDNGPTLGEPQTQRVRVGIIVTAAGGPCKRIVATTPVPIDWPEQQVQEVEEDISAHVQGLAYRMIGGTVRQMVMEIPYLDAGEEARALVTYDITRHSLVAPDEVSQYVLPEHLDRLTRIYLGPSPGIESRNSKIRTAAKEAIAGKDKPWEQVEALYDWVRDNVEYKQGPTKGALDALANHVGDCEEMTSLFIALCRSQGVPARTVWIPGHCYPEFFLEDRDGVGHWFPCQVAGTRAFGGIPEHRPIYQKGDNFLTPERPREKLRYVSEYLTGGGGTPKVKFVREIIGRDGKVTPTPLGVP